VENLLHPEFGKGFQSFNQMVMMLGAILHCPKGPLFFDNLFTLRKTGKRMLVVSILGGRARDEKWNYFRVGMWDVGCDGVHAFSYFGGV
jgi:hypothetical protein